MPKLPAIKKAVRVYLAERGRTQAWLAQQLGIDETLLSRVLSGYRPLTPELADKLQRVTGLDLHHYAGAA